MSLIFLRHYLLKYGLVASLMLYFSYQLPLFDIASVHWILVPTLCTTICSMAYQVPCTTLISTSGRSAFKIGLLSYILTSAPWIIMFVMMGYTRDDFDINYLFSSLAISIFPLAIPQNASEVGLGINVFIMLLNTRIVETFNSKDIYSSIFHSNSLGNYATVTICEFLFIGSSFLLWEHIRFRK